jgi:hypothetical protein
MICGSAAKCSRRANRHSRLSWQTQRHVAHEVKVSERNCDFIRSVITKLREIEKSFATLDAYFPQTVVFGL